MIETRYYLGTGVDEEIITNKAIRYREKLLYGTEKTPLLKPISLEKAKSIILDILTLSPQPSPKAIQDIANSKLKLPEYLSEPIVMEAIVVLSREGKISASTLPTVGYVLHTIPYGLPTRTPAQASPTIAPIVAERKKAWEKEIERREKEKAAPPPFRRLGEPEYTYKTAEMREYKYTSPATGEVTVYYRDFELEKVIRLNNLLPLLPEKYFEIPPPERWLVYPEAPSSIQEAFAEKVLSGTLTWEILTDVYRIPRSYIERWVKLLREGR